MSEISKAMDRSRRDRGVAADAPSAEPRRVVTASTPFRLRHSDTEQYLSLASEISLALPDQESRVILFGSATAGEGTSTVARELAITLAGHGDAETLLIDANLRRPSVQDAFRVQRDPGLSEHILGGAALVDCLRRTDVPRLSVLTAGRPVIAPPRVASDARMKDLLPALRGRFRFVVMDAPPLLAFPEGVQLARLCDGSVVVIRAGHTRRQLPQRAVGLLEEAGAKVLGTVLNRRRFYVPRFVYERI
jgi:capsular exopolysaccharide synthesis family protein